MILLMKIKAQTKAANNLRSFFIMKLFIAFLVFMTTSCVEEKEAGYPQSAKENYLNKKYLVTVLDTTWKTEQEPIRKRDEAFRKFGDSSKEYKKYQAIYKRNHAINEGKIAEILKRGWPGIETIGEQGNLTICNVIQHSSPEIRVKYLAMMRRAVNEKQLSPRLLARAEDRIATDRGELQIYGGQMKYYPKTKTFNVWPVYDPVNIDKRRAKIGLEPIAIFLKRRFNFEWNLEEQIKRTADFEK